MRKFNPKILIISKSGFRPNNYYQKISDNNYLKDMENEHLKLANNMKNIFQKFFPNTFNTTTRDFIKLNENEEKRELYDFIFTLGGDGTLLHASRNIKNENEKIFGINSKPKESVGFLTGMMYDENINKNLEKVCENLINENYKIYKRKRIDLEISSNEKNKKILALNEVFFGSDTKGISSFYSFSYNNKPFERAKSSGVIISTGTGSTAWLKSMHTIPANKLQLIFEYIKFKNYDKHFLKEVQEHLLLKHQFSYDKDSLFFKHIELFYDYNKIKIEDYCDSATIKNNLINSSIIVDGLQYSINLEDKVNVKIADDKYSLNCVSFK